MEDLDELILLQLKRITTDVGDFAIGISTKQITRGEQIGFAHKLVDLAESINERVDGPADLIVDGSAIDDGPSDSWQLASPGRGSGQSCRA